MTQHFQFYTGHQDATAIIVVVCSALSLYNALELLLLIITTFHRYHGLYFSSLVASSFGIILYVVGFVLEYFRLAPQAAGISIDSLGWALMVTGQSVVLYSRLGIVMGKGRRGVLKAIKWMIIVDAVVFHGMTTVVVFGAHFGSHTATFATAYDYIEKIQMTGFTVQEFIISGLYIYQTLQILRSRPTTVRPVTSTTARSDSHSSRSHSSKTTHRIMYQLFSINIIIIALDIGLLTIEYLNLHVMEQTFKGVVYSVKLKLEFAILSKLVEITRDGGRASEACFSNEWADGSNGARDGDGRLNCFSTEWYDANDNRATRLTTGIADEGRPKWLEEVEKDGVEQVERVYSRTRSKGEADVLYADALRSLDK